MGKDKRKMWGREFDIVEGGLDIAQVIAYIEEIRKVQDTDAHIDSLKRLAESTVAEADRIAQEIREEAKAEAKSKAIEIINEAETKLQQVIRAKEKTEKDAQIKAVEIIAEAEKQKHVIEEQAQSIIEAAGAEAASVREGARERANRDLEIFKEKASEKLRDDIRMVHQKLIADLVSLAAEVRILESKWEGLKIEDIEEGSEISSLNNAKELNASPPADIQEYLAKMNGEVDDLLSKNPEQEQKDTAHQEEPDSPDTDEIKGEMEETIQDIAEEKQPESSDAPQEEAPDFDDEEFMGILIETKGIPDGKKDEAEPEQEETASANEDSKKSKNDPVDSDTVSEFDESILNISYEEPENEERPNTFSTSVDDLEEQLNRIGFREEPSGIEELRRSLEAEKDEWSDHGLVDELEQKSANNPILKSLKRGFSNAFGFVKGKR